MKKKWIAGLLLGTMLTVSACGSKVPEETVAEPAATEEAVEEVTENTEEAEKESTSEKSAEEISSENADAVEADEAETEEIQDTETTDEHLPYKIRLSCTAFFIQKEEFLCGKCYGLYCWS